MRYHRVSECFSLRHLLTVFLLAAPCACGWLIEDTYDTSPNPPATPGKSWLQIEDPGIRGWDVDLLDQAKDIFEDINSTSVMVIDDGRLIAAWGATQSRWVIASTRKSLLSSIYGRYVEDGTIALNATLADLGIDDIRPPLTSAQKQAEVQHLLTSSSYICHATAAGSPLEDCPAVPPAPGERFGYNNFDFNVLGTIFRQQTGRDIFIDFQNQVAAPVGMEDFRPEHDGRYLYVQDSLHPAYPMHMSTRDLARFGLLMLREGVWNETPLLLASWVRDSTAAHLPTDACAFDDPTLCADYGYMWWRQAPEVWTHYGVAPTVSFSAEGNYKQGVFVFPERNLVIVHRGHPVFDTVRSGPEAEDVYRLMATVLRAQGVAR